MATALGYRVERFVEARSTRGQDLWRLIESSDEGTTVLARSAFNLIDVRSAARLLRELQKRKLILHLLDEDFLIRGGDRTLTALIHLIEGFTRKQRSEESVKRSLFTRWLGTRMGRKPVSPETRKRVIELLESDFSTRKVSAMLGGAISKTSVAEIARKSRKR